MNDLDEYVQQKKEIGQRFKKFRELMGKTKKEMEQEANHPLIMTEKIKLFEYGAIIPDIINLKIGDRKNGLLCRAGKPRPLSPSPHPPMFRKPLNTPKTRILILYVNNQ